MRINLVFVVIFLLMLISGCQNNLDTVEKKPILNLVWIGDDYLDAGSLDMQTYLMLTEGGQVDVNLSGQRWVESDHTLAAGSVPADIKKLVSENLVDVVVLQAFSVGDVVDKTVFRNHAEEWINFFDSREIDIVVFYPGRGLDQDEASYQAMVNMVLELAWAKKLTIAPIGDAWQRLLDEDPSMGLYAADQIHPSAVGVYINAVVFYCVFTGKSAVNHPVKLSIGFDQPDTIHILEDETIRKIQETVSQIMLTYQNQGEFSVVHKLFLSE